MTALDGTPGVEVIMDAEVRLDPLVVPMALEGAVRVLLGELDVAGGPSEVLGRQVSGQPG